MSLLTEGTSAVERKRKADMKEAVLRLLDELTAGGQAVKFAEVMRKLRRQCRRPGRLCRVRRGDARP